MSEKILWYIADPMCSWCWGFMPVIEKIHAEYGDRLKLELLLGGLRPGTKDPMGRAQRQEILHHWEAVHRMTGQPFRFAGALPEGFIYNTEPASRGVVAVSLIDRGAVFPFFRAVQSAFYTEQQDVTSSLVLAQLAGGMGLDSQRFALIFESDMAKNLTRENFNRSRWLGVSGFPTLLLDNGANYRFLARGYRPSQELCSEIDEWLQS
ncbi:DsbA family protein [Nitrosovibrio tenuis]|uniref:DSBA-like thioredoxin domain-containing protein n=1 Tax=Nitrosovibrio tenuis TaxID=1233 RepID=A0A1H7ME70_9PROT|nr:DsbA family protein [Nitrosovibrio tenuis]SEL09493.1 putative protein-disulfide isomerase [Nitrosovibrio tenuis]